VENLLLRGQRPLVSAIYQNQPLSHYLPPNMQLLQGPNGQVKLRVSSLLNNQRALLEKQRGLDSDYFWHLRVYLDLNDIIEEAFERCGVEVRTGYEHRTARRSLNLLTIEWANRGINLWTIEQGSIPMEQGEAVYALPEGTIDLLDQVIRTQSGVNQTDINISRISVSTYATIPNKNTQGRPIQVWIDRQSGATEPTGLASPEIYVWPTPDQGTLANPFYTFVYWRLRRIQDAGTGTSTQDIPFRMLTCLVAGLAYYLSLKIPEAANRIEMLKMAYEEQWLLASSEDREKASLRLAPREMFY
jgi:hypothetical protein